MLQRLRFFLTYSVLSVCLMAAPSLAKTPVKATVKSTAPMSGAIPALVVAGPAGTLPDMTLGNPNAPVTVVEYASAACPHCAEWNKDTWPAFEAKYIVTGKVHYIFRELLTNPQEYALAAFMTGRCAVAKSKDPTNATAYFTVVQSYFKGQDANYELAPVQQDVAKKTGLAITEQNNCIANGPAMSTFFTNMRAHAETDKVSSTPTFIINGKHVEGREMKDFDAAIADAQK